MVNAKSWLVSELLILCLLFTIMLFHFSPRIHVCNASCHGDTVCLHTMKKVTLQQVRLREVHSLTQLFWLMRKICECSCHATGRSNLAPENI